MRVLPAAAAIVLILAVLLGGGTRQGFLGDVIVQIAACFLVAVTLWKQADAARKWRLSGLDRALLGVALFLCVVQLLPFFPGLGVKSFTLPENVGGLFVFSPSWWGRISLTPAATWAGLVSAIVPVAIFMAVVQCDVKGRLFLWKVVLGLGGLALLFGILQVLQGPDSPLRFFAFTNPNEAVGFFANRNHFAAQLYVTLAFTGAWVCTAGWQVVQNTRLDGRALGSMGGAVAFLLLLTAGLALARSRAGVMIALAVMIGIAVMAVMARPQENGSRKIRRRGTRFILISLIFAVLLAAQFGLQRVASRFETDMADDLRVPLNWATFGEAWSALPFGTGIGSFVRVYGVIEDPANLLPAFANRAHDDLAEFLLEAGLLGAVLVALFLVWFSRHAIHIWRASGHSDDQALNLQRAATLAIGALLLHTLVDYGLRTTSISALFAFACALLTVPAVPETAPERSERRHTRRERPPSARLAPVSPKALTPVGDDIAWPEKWKGKDEAAPRSPAARTMQAFCGYHVTVDTS